MERYLRTGLLGCALAVLTLAPSVLSYALQQPFTLPKYLAVAIASPMLLGFLLAVTFYQGRWRALGQPLPVLFAAQALVILITGFLSDDPRVAVLGSYERQMGWVTYLGIYLVACAIYLGISGGTARFRSAVVGVIVAGLLPAAVGVREYLQTGERIHGTLGNPDFMANYLLFPLFSTAGVGVAVARGWGPRSSPWRWPLMGLLLLGGFMILVALGCTQTRGGILAAGVGLAIFIYLWTVFARPLRRVVRLSIGATVAGVAIATVIFALHLRGFDATGSGRTLVWRDTLAMLEREPWLLLAGCGVENFRVTFMSHRSLELAQYLPDANWRAPHNNLLDVLVQQGCLGLVLYVSLVWVGGRDLLHAIRRASQVDRALLAGVGAALAAYLTHSLFSVDVIVTSLYFCAFLALAGGGMRIDRGPNRQPTPQAASSGTPPVPRGARLHRRMRPLGAWAILLAGIATTGMVAHSARRLIAADRWARQAIAHSLAGHHPEAQAAGATAVQLAPHQGAYHFYYSRAIYPRLDEQITPSERRELLAIATQEAQIATVSTTNPESYWAHLSALYSLAGLSAQTLEALERSIAYDPHYWATRKVMALQLLRLGRPEEAWEHIEMAHRIKPAGEGVQQLRQRVHSALEAKGGLHSRGRDPGSTP